jgi:hypothetical protein
VTEPDPDARVPLWRLRLRAWAGNLAEVADGIGMFLVVAVVLFGPLVGFAAAGAHFFVAGHRVVGGVLGAAALLWPLGLSRALDKVR